MALSTVFFLLFLASIPLFILGMVRPSALQFATRKVLPRKKLLVLIPSLGLACLILAFAVAPTSPATTEGSVANLSQPSQEIEEVEKSAQIMEAVVENVQEVESIVDSTPVQDVTNSPSNRDLLWVAIDTTMKTRQGIDVIYNEEDGGLVVLTHSLESFWDENDLVRQAYADLVYFGAEAFKLEGISEVKVIISAPFTDQYGKSGRDVAVQIAMQKNEFSKYDWGNLTYKPVWQQIKNSSSDYYIHLGLLKGIELSKLTLKSSP